MRLDGFNAGSVEPAKPRTTLPAGKYKCVITSSGEQPTKAMTGTMLKLQLQVIDGPHQGAMVFDQLNLNNPSATAMEMAQRTLSAICHAVGVIMPQDSSDLHNKPLRCKVVVRKSDEYGESNEVKAYKPRLVAPMPQASPMLTQDASPAYQAMRDASPF
jgi:hypothetical protein